MQMRLKFIIKGDCYKSNKCPRSYQDLIEIVRQDFQTKVPENFCFKYEDNDKDTINIESQADFEALQDFYNSEQLKSIKVRIDQIHNKQYVDYTNFSINNQLNSKPENQVIYLGMNPYQPFHYQVKKIYQNSNNQQLNIINQSQCSQQPLQTTPSLSKKTSGINQNQQQMQQQQQQQQQMNILQQQFQQQQQQQLLFQPQAPINPQLNFLNEIQCNRNAQDQNYSFNLQKQLHNPNLLNNPNNFKQTTSIHNLSQDKGSPLDVQSSSQKISKQEDKSQQQLTRNLFQSTFETEQLQYEPLKATKNGSMKDQRNINIPNLETGRNYMPVIDSEELIKIPCQKCFQSADYTCGFCQGKQSISISKKDPLFQCAQSIVEEKIQQADQQFKAAQRKQINSEKITKESMRIIEQIVQQQNKILQKQFFTPQQRDSLTNEQYKYECSLCKNDITEEEYKYVCVDCKNLQAAFCSSCEKKHDQTHKIVEIHKNDNIHVNPQLTKSSQQYELMIDNSSSSNQINSKLKKSSQQIDHNEDQQMQEDGNTISENYKIIAGGSLVNSVKINPTHQQQAFQKSMQQEEQIKKQVKPNEGISGRNSMLFNARNQEPIEKIDTIYSISNDSVNKNQYQQQFFQQDKQQNKRDIQQIKSPIQQQPKYSLLMDSMCVTSRNPVPQVNNNLSKSVILPGRSSITPVNSSGSPTQINTTNINARLSRNWSMSRAINNTVITYIEIRNHGRDKWPDKIFLQCISGNFEQQQYSVASTDIGYCVHLAFPLKIQDGQESFNSNWRLYYVLKEENNEEKKYFGPKITIQYQMNKDKGQDLELALRLNPEKIIIDYLAEIFQKDDKYQIEKFIKENDQHLQAFTDHNEIIQNFPMVLLKYIELYVSVGNVNNSNTQSQEQY